MKFNGFVKEKSDLIWMKDGYAVYRHNGFFRYFLVKHDTELAFKNVSDKEPDFSKWVLSWEKNAKNQINRLQDRMTDLQAQQNEFRRLSK